MNYPPRPEHLHERLTFAIDHPSLTATTTLKFGKVSRPFVVTKAYYNNPTGLAQSGSNSFAIALKNGATVIATGVDTASTAVVAGTTVDMTLTATTANRLLETDAELSVVFTETGAATLPVGRIVVEGFYL